MRRPSDCHPGVLPGFSKMPDLIHNQMILMKKIPKTNAYLNDPPSITHQLKKTIVFNRLSIFTWSSTGLQSVTHQLPVN